MILYLTGVLGLCGTWLAGVPAFAADPAPKDGTETTLRVVEKEVTIKERTVYEAEPKAPRKVAIFVRNTAGPEFNDKVAFFEDQVTARISGQGYAVISSDDVVKALKVYRTSDGGVRTRSSESRGDLNLSAERVAKSTTDLSAQGTGAVRVTPDQSTAGARSEVSGGAERTAEGKLRVAGDASATTSKTDKWSEIRSDPERNALGTELDQVLANNTSALRLAQNMGADFLLFASIGAYDEEVQETDNGVLKLKSTVATLTGSYKVAEGFTGSSLGGGPFEATKATRTTAAIKIKSTATFNQLLKDGATKVAEGLIAKASSFRPPPAARAIEFAVACAVRDLVGHEISLPDLRVKEDGTLVNTGQVIPAQALANISIDGFGVGTTPAKVKTTPGPHKLRLTRAGFDPYEDNILVREGASFTPTLQLSAAGFERWKEIRDFLNGLDTQRKLTDATVKVMEGYAQKLRQSGFLVDYRVNTTNAPVINNYRSIYSLPPGL